MNCVAAISLHQPHRRSWTCSDLGCAHLTPTQYALQWKCWSGFFLFHFLLKRAAWDTSCGSMNSCICGRCVTMRRPGKETWCGSWHDLHGAILAILTGSRTSHWCSPGSCTASNFLCPTRMYTIPNIINWTFQLWCSGLYLYWWVTVCLCVENAQACVVKGHYNYVEKLNDRNDLDLKSSFCTLFILILW
jgi:hypothetical protein